MFLEKAGPVLDLYHRRWQGKALGPRDFVLSADEKTQIQLRGRRHPITAPGPRRPMRVESEYKRHGTCAYLAAWDVHRGKLFGQVAETISIATFDALVADVMRRAPYRTAPRAFWIVDNGTIHRGPGPSNGFALDGPTSFWSTCRFMRAGSIRSRSTSPSYSAKR